MMIARVKFAPWDKAYDFSFTDLKLVVGDWVMVETELGQEAAKILTIIKGDNKQDLKPVLKKLSFDDVALVTNQEKREEALSACQDLIDRNNLSMKLVDVHISASSKRYNFAFISDNRVDFRNLVKDLAIKLGANIRLTQIGSRDEARLSGDCGSCGRPLCCRGFMTDFISITSEMAEAQQVVHRGSERISGMCGRLMCCLSYEYEGYKEMAGKLPPVGTKVNFEGSRGVVVGQHLLKQTVDVKLNSSKEGERPIIVEVDVNRHKKNIPIAEKIMGKKLGHRDKK